MTNDGWTLPKTPLRRFTKESFGSKISIEIFEDSITVGISRNFTSMSFILTKEQFEELKLWMVLG